MDRDIMDLSLVARQARHNSERWFGVMHDEHPSTLKYFYGLALAGEVGELANLLKKHWRTQEQNTLDVADELADAFTYLLLLADELRVDLLDALEKKQAVCEARWGNG